MYKSRGVSYNHCLPANSDKASACPRFSTGVGPQVSPFVILHSCPVREGAWLGTRKRDRPSRSYHGVDLSEDPWGSRFSWSGPDCPEDIEDLLPTGFINVICGVALVYTDGLAAMHEVCV
ncbi:hypothetical protein DPEC_G00137650 [Dallia pectoralis]|uniref:Uncharacterized protein n=1 Tax=Dallia pectoralis TaxID=75939 RepID=A0ACC2GM88_DALPE|nr:hypothetical protein DPEC_G00137650 [Dallia pectoralis]